MSVLNQLRRLVVVIALAAIGQSVSGQVYHPFAEPMQFNPDWQFFAPVDVDSLLETPSRKRANTGWFATYDRTYQWVSRPEVEDSRANGDFAWGNRYDLGFMTEDRSGWLFSLRHIGGPNAYQNIYQERINRANTADTGPGDTTPVVPFLDQNDEQYGTRAYILGDSLNVASMSNVEINKTWRREPYRYGGIIEPMIGLRYTSFNDLALTQSYARSRDLISVQGTQAATDLVEQLISQEMRTRNQMWGGQLGFRYFNYYKRWTLSSELRAFGMQNFQNQQYAQKAFVTEYAGVGLGTAVVATSNTATFINTSNNEFVVGFEARAEAAYQVTRYLSIRGGVDVLDFAKGIWRGHNNPVDPLNPNVPAVRGITDHSQDVQIAGFTFGLTLNR